MYLQDNTNHFTFRNIVLQVILKWKRSRHFKYIPLEFVCISLTPKSPRPCLTAGYSCLVMFRKRIFQLCCAALLPIKMQDKSVQGQQQGCHHAILFLIHFTAFIHKNMWMKEPLKYKSLNSHSSHLTGLQVAFNPWSKRKNMLLI